MKKWPFVAGNLVLAGSLALLSGSCAHRAEIGMEESYGLHSSPDPAHFKNFHMPAAVDVRGLGTSAALEKLRVSYLGVCKQNGEKPRDLAFEVPAGHEKPLRIKLSSGTLDSSVRGIAAASKLEVIRDGTTYRFKEPKETGALVRRTFNVPPDFAYRFGESGNEKLAAAIQQDPRIGFQHLGIDLDESTKLTFRKNPYTLAMETRSAADQVAIATALTRDGLPVQQRVAAQVFEVPPNSDLKEIREGSFDAETANRIVQNLSNREDVKSSEVLGITNRSGETGVIKKTDATLRVKTSLLGSGHEVQTDLSASFKGERVQLHHRGYASDTSTRFTVKTLPDGSRVVLAVTPTLIDATGRPVYPKAQ